MSAINEKARLRLRVIGPLESDETLPLGATAWITAGDDEPLVVDIPVGTGHEPKTVDVSAGRVIILLRTPAGRRGRKEIVLEPGEEKSFEFGKAKPPARVVIRDAKIEIPQIPIQRPPNRHIDPNTIEQSYPTFELDPLPDGSESGGSWGHMNGLPGQSGGNRIEWMPQIHKVQVFSQKGAGDTKIEHCVVQQNAPPRGVYSFKSSTTHLELGMVGSVAFVVEPAAPHQTHVLFHRAAWTHDKARFTVKPRRDATMIPIDTEVILGDELLMALLAFIANGDLPSARAQAARFSDAAGAYLSDKFTNHHLAAVGAYALHLLRETDKYANWIHTLYERFGDLGDSAILYATHLMSTRPGAISEWYDEARTALLAAAARPIPLLTAGVHLLVQGLERLSSSRRAAGDEKLAQALERAQWIQARTRPDEIFTALWMDRGDLPRAFLPYDLNKISSSH
jgi:hypothetical protein